MRLFRRAEVRFMDGPLAGQSRRLPERLLSHPYIVEHEDLIYDSTGRSLTAGRRNLRKVTRTTYRISQGNSGGWLAVSVA